MSCSLSVLLAVTLVLVPSIWGQIITYSPSKAGGISYSINIPENTVQNINGTIYLQLSAPSNIEWVALSQGMQMTGGNIFVVYASPDGNVTLSPRKALGHQGVFYDPTIQAYLLEGSGIHDGMLTANIRCDSCLRLNNGESILGIASSWGWATCYEETLVSGDISANIHKHDYHGIFTLDLTPAVGGNSSNPFTDLTYSRLDATPLSKQHQIDDAMLHKKRIAHGVMTPAAFVLWFPGFALLLHLFPSPYTVMWIHAPLQILAISLAVAGLIIGVSLQKDLNELGGYHPIIGYVSIGAVVLFQPFLGFMQHRHFRRSGGASGYGVSHRWVGRICIGIGIINGGIGFHYASQRTPDIPTIAPMIYGGLCAGVCMFYVFVITRSRGKAKLQAARAESGPEYFQSKGQLGQRSDHVGSALSSSDTTTSHLSEEKLRFP
ncbi:hypothetical protein BDV28DRAFT_149667 [Aspergillus coremiiformis]|uniref:Cytochrome b561 domain-containing protein n=1 Tax=Aspergillus coremiiformis TaxID=138285 RepID=A0A5N6Z299_9EURO|nr:hypothetical protein BDV28DRAFT_149667 [Aspergillus coremiiformis]